MPTILKRKTDKQRKDIFVDRKNLKKTKIDAEGRDFLVAFNEPAFKYSQHGLTEGDLDSKLNARLLSYFLPAVEVARKQSERPRLYIVSGLNMALRWNARSEHQKKIMMIDNNLKIDFLRNFFEEFFYDNFSIIEYVVAQDPIKISDAKLISLWKILERRYPAEVEDLKLTLAKYKKPRLFNTQTLSPEARKFLTVQSEELVGAFKYAVSHLFVLADINFEGNYVHNPTGYLTIGGPAEETFNKIRDLALKVLADIAEVVFERDVIMKDNLRLVVDPKTRSPVPYNGNFESYGNDKLRLAEVTYENNESLSFYDSHEKLKSDMEYIYEFIDRDEYQKFWDKYKTRYFELKKRYREAYNLAEDF